MIAEKFGPGFLTSGSLDNAVIEISRGTVLIIIPCNPTSVYRFVNQDPNFPPGLYIPEPVQT